jgi:hypothetical protein
VPVETHLSRNEVTVLLYDKLLLIEAEAGEAQQHEGKWTAAHLADTKARLKRIAVEARRAASLIETHEACAKAGHCLHCGKTYGEHEELPGPLPEGVRVRPKQHDEAAPRCLAMRHLFESVEVETYRPLAMLEADRG